jgi:hypothetical protein
MSPGRAVPASQVAPCRSGPHRGHSICDSPTSAAKVLTHCLRHRLIEKHQLALIKYPVVSQLVHSVVV